MLYLSCVLHSAAVGKADTAAALVAQQSADISAEKVAAQPNPLAATYNIGIIIYHSLTRPFVNYLGDFKSQ